MVDKIQPYNLHKFLKEKKKKHKPITGKKKKKTLGTVEINVKMLWT